MTELMCARLIDRLAKAQNMEERVSIVREVMPMQSTEDIEWMISTMFVEVRT